MKQKEKLRKKNRDIWIEILAKSSIVGCAGCGYILLFSSTPIKLRLFLGCVLSACTWKMLK